MVFDGTATQSDDGMQGLCGEDAREEVEVSTFMFGHLVVESGLQLCGCSAFLGGRVRYVERVWLRSSGQGPCVVWWVNMQYPPFVGGDGGSVGG